MLHNQLITAVKSGMSDDVAALVTSIDLANTRDENGYSLLCWAALEGKEDIVDLLLERGAELDDDKNKNGSTPLHCAASKGHLSVVKKLVDRHSDLNKVNLLGLTPLFYALYDCHTEVSMYLIEKGVRLDLPDNEEGQTAFCAAVAAGSDKLVKFMLLRGLNVDEKNMKGDTPLLIAVQNNDTTMVKTLLDNNADPNIICNGDSCLHYAVRNNLLPMVKLLLDNLVIKTDSNLQDTKYKRTPLHDAVYLGHQHIVGSLAPLSKLDPEEIKHRRNLSVIFNNLDVNEKLQQIDSISYEGGYNREFFILVSPKLKKFITDNGVDKLNSCIECMNKAYYYNTLPSKELITELDKVQTIMFCRGFDIHTIPYTIRKIAEDQYTLTMIDRGALSTKSKTHSDKACSARTLGPIPKDKLPQVIEMVRDADFAKHEDAEKILLKDIPAYVGLPYQNDERLVQKAFKRGQCFFENCKSWLLAEFINAYGVDKGKVLYKQFDIMMHEEALREFIDYFRPKLAKDKLFIETVSKCREILAFKKNHLLQLAISNKDESLVKQLLDESVDVSKPMGKSTNAYEYAILYGNDEIMDLLRAYKEYRLSVELAERFSGYYPKPITNAELEAAKKEDSLRFKMLQAKQLIDIGDWTQAQKTEPIFFDRYVIQPILHNPKAKNTNIKHSLSDSMFLRAHNPDSLIHLASYYKSGDFVQMDLLTAESLYQQALNKIISKEIRCFVAKEKVESELQTIRQLQVASKESFNKINQQFLEKWNFEDNTQKNLINLFTNFNSWKLKPWHHTYTKDVSQLLEWLAQPNRSLEEIRAFMLEKRFSLLQSGNEVEAPIIKALTFAVLQSTPGFNQTLQPGVAEKPKAVNQ